MSTTPPYAGAVSRLIAYVVDVVAVAALFSGGAAVVALLTRVVIGRELGLSGDRDLASLALVAWWLVYFSVSWAATGTTLGMALLGLRVVQPDGAPVGLARAVTRTLAFSLSVALFGLGFLGIVLNNQRRALHDLVAGTAVIYTTRPPSSGNVVAAQRIIRTG